MAATTADATVTTRSLSRDITMASPPGARSGSSNQAASDNPKPPIVACGIAARNLAARLIATPASASAFHSLTPLPQQARIRAA